MYAKDQVFPKSMSKWNRRGMGPDNLSLIDDLLEHLFERRFVAANLLHASLPHLDLIRPVVLRAGSF